MVLGCLIAAGVAYRWAMRSRFDGQREFQLLNVLPGWIDVFAVGMVLAVVSVWLSDRREPTAFRRRIFPAVSWTLAAAAFVAISLLMGRPGRIDTLAQDMGVHYFYLAVGLFFLLPGIFGPQRVGLIRHVLENRVVQLLGPDLLRPVPLERDAAREVHPVDGQHAVQHVVPQDARGRLRLDGAGGDGELRRGREARAVAEGTGAVPPSGCDTSRLTTTRNRAFLIAILAIALVALAVRVVFVLVVDPKLPDPGDATAYHLLANNLADGHGYIRPFDFRILHVTRPTAEYPPLFPALLAVPSFLGAKSVDASGCSSASWEPGPSCSSASSAAASAARSSA